MEGDNTPQPEKEELAADLEAAIRDLKEKGADTPLRLFACWCARQTDLEKELWLKAVATSEGFARGEIDRTTMEETRSRMKEMAVAAAVIGLNRKASNAAAALAAFQTLRSDAAEAAIHTANMSARWSRLKEKTGEAEKETRQQQNEALLRISSDFLKGR